MTGSGASSGSSGGEGGAVALGSAPIGPGSKGEHEAATISAASQILFDQTATVVIFDSTFLDDDSNFVNGDHFARASNG
jgi:hypothetical protein